MKSLQRAEHACYYLRSQTEDGEAHSPYATHIRQAESTFVRPASLPCNPSSRQSETITHQGMERHRAPAVPFRVVRAALYEPQALSSELATRWDVWLRWRRDRIAVELTVDADLSMERRRERMNAVNPCYVPRNYLLQVAIDAATEGDLAPLEELRQVLGNPYEKRAGFERYAMRRPDWARDRPGCSALSCSS